MLEAEMTARTEEPCWLCGKPSALTREHYPPASAFNAMPLILQGLSDETITRGEAIWEDKHAFSDGLWSRSICKECNGRAGQKFAPSYAVLVRGIVEELRAQRRFRTHLTMRKVQNSRLILKQIVHQFVSVNGPSFVTANPWVEECLESSRPFTLPDDVFLYAYVMRHPNARMSGVAGFIDLNARNYSLYSEFAFPPLGTVMSYGPLTEPRLAPIRDWAKVPKGMPVDVTLPVNNVLSHTPLDFRSAVDIRLALFHKRPSPPSDELVRDMFAECQRRSGKNSDDYALFALPTEPGAISPQQIDGELLRDRS